MSDEKQADTGGMRSGYAHIIQAVIRIVKYNRE